MILPALSTPELTLCQSTVATINTALASYDAASDHAGRDAALRQLYDVLTQDVRVLAARLVQEQKTALSAEISAALAPYYTDPNHLEDGIAATDAMVGIGHQGGFVYGASDRINAKAVRRFMQTAIDAQP